MRACCPEIRRAVFGQSPRLGGLCLNRALPRFAVSRSAVTVTAAAASSSGSEHAAYIRDVAAADPPPNLSCLLRVLEAQGEQVRETIKMAPPSEGRLKFSLFSRLIFAFRPPWPAAARRTSRRHSAPFASA